MNRRQMRASTAHGRKLQKMPWQPFRELSRAEIEALDKRGDGALPDRIFKNNRYVVQIYGWNTGWGKCDRVLIRRADASAIHNWHELQRLKNEIWGPECTALEVYPKASNLIDDKNIYWMWVFPPEFQCPIEIQLAPRRASKEEMLADFEKRSEEE